MSNLRTITTPYNDADTRQYIPEKPDELTEFEQVVYDFVEARGEILTSNIPRRMRGGIPNWKNKGVIEVFKKRTSRWVSKKRKFVKVRRNDS